MTKTILRRLIAMPVFVFLANALGYVYGYYLGPAQLARGPYGLGASELPSVIPFYIGYLQEAFKLNFGMLANNQTVGDAIVNTLIASSGLLFIALALSAICGILIGRAGVESYPPRISGWLTFLSTIGQASPSFYIGILFISFSVIFLIWGPFQKPLLPFQGYGWDAHLVLPVLALMIHPTFKIAHVTAGLLSGEFVKNYVASARSFGHTEKSIRSHVAFRNVIAPIALVIAGSMRLLIAELIIIERLFNWPGLGKLISTTLVMTSHSDNFLNPSLMAALLALLVFIFLFSDLVAAIIALSIDPRLRTGDV
jgi:ABC-type dipeptide/oligopeptide/nickel transport system permease component